MKWALPVAVVVVMTVLVLDFGTSYAAQDDYAFSLHEISTGQQLSKDLLTDEKPLVVHLWSANCPHCKRHMPYVASLYSKLDLNAVNFITICVDSTEQEANDYIAKWNLQFPVLLSGSGSLGDAYYKEGWPTTYIFSAAGDLVGISDDPGPAYLDQTMGLAEAAML